MSPKQAPMTNKRVKQIARHYLGSKLLSVSSDTYGTHTVFIRCGNAFFKVQDQEDLIRHCERWHKMFVEDGWKPTHPRLEWVRNVDEQIWELEFQIKSTSIQLMNVCRRSVAGSNFTQKEVSFFTTGGVSPYMSMGYTSPEEASAAISAWVEANLPYYLPDPPVCT